MLAEVDPGWWNGGADPALLRQARDSTIGRRLLAGWLAEDVGAALLAPGPGRDPGALAENWPRARLQPLLRDAGILAHAPAIRAEVRREPVRRLKQVLGNSYLLALDRSVWDGKLDAEVVAAMSARLADALAAASPESALHILFERQGRAELRAWARHRDPPLADWVALTHPREDPATAHLPERALLRVYTHHESRQPA